MFEFIERYQNQHVTQNHITTHDEAWIEAAVGIYKGSLERQWFRTEAEAPDAVLRASNLGAPAIELFAKKWKPEWFVPGPSDYSSVLPDEEDNTGNTWRLTQLFHCGDTFEADFVMLCRLFGYKILESQTEVDLSPLLGLQVKGHLDFVVESPNGEVFIIDTKTCSDRSFTTMSKDMMAEKRQYVTQIALYYWWLQENRNYKELTPGWILYNKNNSQLEWVKCKPEWVDESLDTVLHFVQTWKELDGKSWDAVTTHVLPPMPVEEVYRKKRTGCYLLPPSMRYSPIAHRVYDIVEEPNGYGKMTKYVRDMTPWDN